MFGATRRLSSVISTLFICILLLCFAIAVGAKPRKKSRKQKETVAQKTARLNREAAIRRAILLEISISQANAVNGDFSSNSGRVSVRTGPTAATGNSSLAQFVADTEAPNPDLHPLAGSLVINEFRFRGPGGPNDEFIEIYNNSGADHTVNALSGTGYGIAASDGVTRCTIPNGTVIPALGHFLCVNTVAFSLSTYPAGSSTIGFGDAAYTTDIVDNTGIALFNNNTGGASYSLANRFDAVGFVTEANTLYKEGTGLPALSTVMNTDYSFYRDTCGKGGSIQTFGPCTISTPKDTDNNAADFVFVDTNGTSLGAGQRLGAPGPEKLASPIQRNSTVSNFLLDATVAAPSPPNQVRDFTSDSANNSTFGTISLRRRFVNNTGASITRLRFRIVDLTTFPAPSGFADLRARTSSSVVVAGINDTVTCTAAGQATPCAVTVNGTTLEQAPAQPNGGGFNSSLSVGTITLGTPLANGASVNIQFLLGIQQTGSFKIFVNIEALP